MDPNTDRLLALICLRVLADTAYGCSWIALTSTSSLKTYFRILGITDEAIRDRYTTLTTQGLVEQETSRIRLTPLGYLQSQMPYTPEHPPCTWYEQVVQHLYTVHGTPERQVTV